MFATVCRYRVMVGTPVTELMFPGFLFGTPFAELTNSQQETSMTRWWAAGYANAMGFTVHQQTAKQQKKRKKLKPNKARKQSATPLLPFYSPAVACCF
ncbi:unnamed protein product [Linum trigynum]|uniref:Uncharacterized protein n=1 Tax=Linum trigynum TaxID=586398 RepID=A0AAV2CM98_9ROSI